MSDQPGLETQDKRDHWLSLHWNAPERQEEKDNWAPVRVSDDFQNQPEAQQFRCCDAWTVGKKITLELDIDGHLMIVDMHP